MRKPGQAVVAVNGSSPQQRPSWQLLLTRAALTPRDGRKRLAHGFVRCRGVVVRLPTKLSAIANRSLVLKNLNMKRLLLASAFLLSINAWSADLALGQPMPAIEAKLLDSSQTIQVGPGTGKVTIINFWATWCAPCRAEMPAIQSYYDKHKSQGLEVLAISMDAPRELAEVRRVAQAFSFPIALKTEANFKGLGRIWRMPSTFVVDKNGILRKNGHVGDPTVNLDSLEALVTPLLEKP